MIPQLVANSELHKACLTSAVQDAFTTCSALLGPDWTAPGYVDWFRVESLGAVGKYGSFKENQVHHHGMPKWYADFMAQEQKKQVAAAQEQKAKLATDKAKAAQATKAAQLEAKLWVEMVPTIGNEQPIKVKKIYRAKAA
jgi:hypothetical protein